MSRKPFEPLKPEFYEVQLGHGFYYVDADEVHAAIAQDKAEYLRVVAAWDKTLGDAQQLRADLASAKKEIEELKSELDDADRVIELTKERWKECRAEIARLKKENEH